MHGRFRIDSNQLCGSLVSRSGRFPAIASKTVKETTEVRDRNKREKKERD